MSDIQRKIDLNRHSKIEEKIPPSPWRFVVIYVLLATGIIFVGYKYFILNPTLKHLIVDTLLFILLIVTFTLGLLSILRKRLADFYRKQYEADALCTHIEVALNDALEQSLKKQNEIEALYESAHAILEAGDFKNSANLVFDSCRKLIGALGGYVALLRDDGEDHEISYLEGGGLPCSVNLSLPMPIRGLRQKAYELGRAIYENDFKKSEYAKLLPQGHAPLENVLFVPMIIHGKKMGLLGFGNKPGGFTEDDARIVGTFGELAAIALMNSENIKSLKENQETLIKERNELGQKVARRTAELLAAERLSAIGTLAATVAHELRNPLGVIQLAVENMRRKDISPETDKHLVRIEKKVVESSLIIDNLLFYSRLRQPQFENVQIHKVLEECINMAQASNKHKSVFVERRYEPIKDVVAQADPLQMKEVFNNVIVNAYQALKDGGGKIEIEALLNEKSFIEIFIKDNGVGMSKEDLDRAHEPFFSTKSKGTGLGLTICDEMIKMHNGKMVISSDVGVGTTVKICLPLNRNISC